MIIHNVHERRIPMSPEAAGRLLDGLSGEEDLLWPRRWPPMRLDRGLEVGSRGGHGPIRYHVEAWLPAERVVFRFDPAIGLVGTHAFEIEPASGGCVLRHTIEARTTGTMQVAWPLAVRWLHDALLEDALDRAEVAAGVSPSGPGWSFWVRVLRAAVQLRSGSRRPTRPRVLRQE